MQASGGLVANLCINPAAEGRISAEAIARNLQQVVDQIREGQFVSMAGLAEETPHA